MRNLIRLHFQALTCHHAVRGNLADVASKDSVQETCVNLIASFLGIFLLTHITDATVLQLLFVFVTFLHIFANVKAVKSVCLRTFNQARYLIALEEYFKTGNMLTPRLVNRLERVTVGQTVSLTAKVKIGLSAKNFVDQYKNSYDIDAIMSYFDSRDKFFLVEIKSYVGVFLHYDIKTLDILKAYFYAASFLQDKNQIRDRYWDIQNKWNEFLNLCAAAGWSTQTHLLPVEEYRLEWRM